MTVHLVETSEEESFQAVAAHVAGLLGSEEAGTAFLAEYNTLVEEGNVEELVAKLSAQLPLVVEQGNTSDVECVLAVLVHLVARLPEDAASRATRRLAAAIATQPEAFGAAKLAALANLYSAAPTPVAAYHALLAAAGFAASDRALAVTLAGAVKGKAEAWQREWRLPDAMARELFLALAQLLKVAGTRAGVKEYFKVVTAALGLAIEPADLAEVKAVAVAAVAAFIASPDTYQCDFADLPAVTQLASDPEHAPLLALLRALLDGDMRAYSAAATPEALAAANITADAALEKARLMALLVVGGRAADAHARATFSDIQAALEIGEDQVQPWLVKAMGRKLLDGRIDQVARNVAVTRCHHRAFVASEWARLEEQLGAWQRSLSAVASSLAEGGGAAAAAAAAGARLQAAVRG